MTDNIKNYKTLSINAAEYGGYYIIANGSVVFAGTLDQCLRWVEGHIAL